MPGCGRGTSMFLVYTLIVKQVITAISRDYDQPTELLLVSFPSQQADFVHPVLVWCWSTVYDTSTTLGMRLVSTGQPACCDFSRSGSTGGTSESTGVNRLIWGPTQHKTLNQCCFNVGPASKTVYQRKTNIDSSFCVCCAGPFQWRGQTWRRFFCLFFSVCGDFSRCFNH